MGRGQIAAIAIGVVLLVGVVMAISAIGGGHTLRAGFDGAVQIIPGQEVRVGGRKVGQVASVEEVDGQAILGLEVADDDVWPLPRGTSARLRWGSNTGYAIRYVELIPPRAGGPPLPDGGLLTKTVTPVELDQTYRIFRGRTRDDLGRVVGGLGETFKDRARPLARSVREAPGGLDPLADLLREMGADREALRTLAVSAARTSEAVAARDSELQGFVVHAAATFDELASHESAQQRSLEKFPETLDTSTSTLARLDGSLVDLRALVGDLEPGARALRKLAPPTRAALAELRDVAPLAASTLRRGTEAAPPVERLLANGTPFLPRVERALDQLAPMVGCLRPYGPEITGMLSGWIGFLQNYDADGHYVRAYLQQPPIPIGTAQSSQKAVASHSRSLSYAMPRPPGLNADQVWLQPQCGAGSDALDPAKDPEGAGR